MREICISIVLCLLTIGAARAKDYNILDFGARADTSFSSTKAIQAAIDVCNRDGGGRVIVPAGHFITGTIILKSNVELYIESGAILFGSRNIQDYQDIKPGYVSLRTQGMTRQLIYAENADHIAICGLGEINGQGKGFVKTRRNDEGVTRPHLLRFVTCQDVKVQDVTLKNSGAWMEHYLACDRVQIRGVKIYNRNNYNNDGIDLDGCRNVIVSDVICDSDDDGITLKSTSPRTCENIAITNCVVSSHCNAIKMGTESNGGFKNITVSNCIVKPSEDTLPRFFGKKTGITGIALEIVDGGVMDGICISNVRIEGTRSPIFIRLGNRARPYKEGMQVTGVGTLKNIAISNVVIASTEKMGCSITGIPGHPVENIHLSGICFCNQGGGKKEDAGRTVEERETSYPEGDMFGVLPAYGFYIRHARNLSIAGGDLAIINPDARPALYLDDVEDGKIANMHLQGDGSSEATVWLNQAKDIVVEGCVLKGAPASFIRAEGSLTRSIFCVDNILPETKNAVSLKDADKKAVKESGNSY